MNEKEQVLVMCEVLDLADPKRLEFFIDLVIDVVNDHVMPDRNCNLPNSLRALSDFWLGEYASEEYLNER